VGDSLDDRLGDAIGELAGRLSLVNLDEESDPWLHRLIAGFVRNIVDAGDLYGNVITAVLWEMARADDDADTMAYAELEKTAPHADCLTLAEHAAAEQVIDLHSFLSTHCRTCGRFRQAEQYGRKALAITEESLEPGDPFISGRQSNLALALLELGELEEARELLRRALASYEQSFAPGHPSIAISQSNLATVLQDLGELEEARDLLRRALASDEQSFALGHPSIATSQSNLATVLQDLGELEEARELVEKAYGAYLKLFGPDHHITRRIKGNLDVIVAAMNAS